VLLQSKAVALLACLTIPSPDRFLRRDALVGLLWPELDQARARKALRQTTLVIRTSLGPNSLASRGDEDLALDGQVVSCDVAAFTRAAEDGLLTQALELYRGDLMPGFHLAGCVEFDRWLEGERSDARDRAAGAAWALAQRLEGTSKLSEAGAMARRAMKFSWTDERALRRALGMLERLGDRAGAVRLYEDFRLRLAADLDVAPSAETEALIARIRAS
jgi:DNA-binding SARP family transcriptional activator